MDLYAVLGIASNAEQETIRSAYRILARRYHPDTGSGSSAEKFRQITEAYETLTDPSRRAVYDSFLVQSRSPLPLKVEPMVARPEPLRQETWDLFGRTVGAPFGGGNRKLYGLDEVLEQYLRLFEAELLQRLWRL
jgi:curved DNA-binding protein CbpA